MSQGLCQATNRASASCESRESAGAGYYSQNGSSTGMRGVMDGPSLRSQSPRREGEGWWRGWHGGQWRYCLVQFCGGASPKWVRGDFPFLWVFSLFFWRAGSIISVVLCLKFSSGLSCLPALEAILPLEIGASCSCLCKVHNSTFCPSSL